jgi:lysophospholipase L1-like esterase
MNRRLPLRAPALRTVRIARRVAIACAAGLLAATLTGCGGGGGGGGGGEATTVPAAVGNTPTALAPGRWVVMGSSSAAGVGATVGQAWAPRLAEAYRDRGVTLDNLARSGAVTPQVLPADAPAGGGRPAPDPAINIDRALSLKPVLLLLSFPTNDTVAGYPATETAANLQLLRDRAAGAGVPTVVLGTQPRDGLSAAQQAAQAALDQALAARAGDCFVALQASLGDGSGRIRADYAAGDGIHLNDAGHAAVLAQVRAALDGGRCVRLASP